MATEQVCFTVLLLFTATTGVDIKTYIMDNYCNKTLNIGYMVNSFKLNFNRYGLGLTKQCNMHIHASSIFNYRFYIRFLDININCSRSNVRLYDGSVKLLLSPELGSKFCGQSNPGTLRTTGQDLYIKFTSSEYLHQDEFTLLISTFSEGPCKTYEFECTNGWCIDRTLRCDDNDDCGDNSDYCYKNIIWWVWMVIGFGVFLIICIVITVVCYCVFKKRSSQHTVTKTSKQPVIHHKSGTNNMVTPGYPLNRTPIKQPQLHLQTLGAYPSPQGTYQTGRAQYSASIMPKPSYTSSSGTSMVPFSKSLQLALIQSHQILKQLRCNSAVIVLVYINNFD